MDIIYYAVVSILGFIKSKNKRFNCKNNSRSNKKKNKPDREMRKYFCDRQPIRHKGSCNNTWYGVYNSETNKIIREGLSYNTPSGFAKCHYKKDKPNRRNSNANGWTECECQVNGKWITPEIKKHKFKIIESFLTFIRYIKNNKETPTPWIP